MKIIAYYLPQFHRIPENDLWWGEGFTEWVNVKKAESLFEGHVQPKVPLNENYYNLLDVDVMRWQTEIAKQHGVYGFCFYHYWFDGKMLLEKPVENFLEKKSIDFPYCICWANEHWTNQWVADKHNVLIEQRYGGKKEWKGHFEYLLPYFLDNRYMKKDGKPVFVLYRPDLVDDRKQMLDYWNELAIEAGLPGICFMCQRPDAMLNGSSSDLSMFDYCIEYQPGVAFRNVLEKTQKFMWLRKMKRAFLLYLEKTFGISTAGMQTSKLSGNVTKFDYDEVWESIVSQEPMFSNSIPGGFVNWDNTPRKGVRGSAVTGYSPLKFKNYLSRQIKHAKDVYHQDMMFMFAWNEWAEGGYMEPDEENQYGYLEAIREALLENDEFPEY